MKGPTADALMYILLVVCIAATVLVVQAVNWFAPVGVQAKATDPACIPFGATGNIVISRCIDPENGNILYVNNIGFMAVAP